LRISPLPFSISCARRRNNPMMPVEDILNKVQKNSANIVVIIVCLFIAAKLYSAQTKRIDAMRASTDMELQKSAVLQQIRTSEGRLKNLSRQMNIKDETTVFNALNDIARNAGVKIINLKPGTTQKNPGYLNIPHTLNIAVESYHMLGKFISALENHPYAFIVDNIFVAMDPAAGGKKYKMQVTLGVSTILIKE
jgi:hypothetical protein